MAEGMANATEAGSYVSSSTSGVSRGFELAVGVNRVAVVVTSEDGNRTVSYVLNLRRAEPSRNSTLASLTVGFSLAPEVDEAFYLSQVATLPTLQLVPVSRRLRRCFLGFGASAPRDPS